MTRCFSVCSTRRGVAVLLVLAILSVSLAITYAVMRSQSVMARVQQNAGTHMTAHDAAITGMSIALRKMHKSDWAGVGSSLNGNLGPDTSYEVTYTTGDPSLEDPNNPGSPDPTHPDYEDWPYRVTIQSTGIAATPGESTAPAEHTVRAVVRFVPRALGTQPSAWDEINAYTMYQYDNVDSYIHTPARISGPVRLRGALEVSPDYNWLDPVRDQYLGDLVTMYDNGGEDRRVLTGPLTLPSGYIPSTVLSLLQSVMQIPVSNGSSSTLSGWNYPGSINTYRLYPGGKLYNVASLPSLLSGQSLGPDPDTNPAGLFYNSGDVDIEDEVSITGTIVAGLRVNLDGQNISIQAAALPALQDTSETVNLPIVIAGDDLRALDECQATLNGLVAVWDLFEVPSITASEEDMSFTLVGRLVFREMRIERRGAWDLTKNAWNGLYDDFQDNLSSADPIPYFPTYLESLGYSMEPKIAFSEPESAVVYHWITDGQSIYAPASGDEGLMWNLIDWKDPS